MSTDTNNTYALSLKEINEVLKLIQLQSILGKYADPLTMESNLEVVKLLGGDVSLSMTKNKYQAIVNGGLLLEYQKYFKNEHLLLWLDGMSSNVINAKVNINNDNTEYPKMYLAYAYSQYLDTLSSQYADSFKNSQDQLAYDTWTGFRKGTSFTITHPETNTSDRIYISAFPTLTIQGGGAKANEWAIAVNESYAAISNGRPISLFVTRAGFNESLLTAQLNKFSPSNWTNNSEFRPDLAPLWTDQLSVLANMKNGNLDYDQCVFLVYLLLGLDTGNIEQRTAVSRVTSAYCTSREIRNSYFVNILVYLFLMILADPLGRYGQSNAEIRIILEDITKQIVKTDGGSLSFKNQFIQQLKILNSAEGYPMTDPYNMDIAFDTRKSDMLFALNESWSKLTLK